MVGGTTGPVLELNRSSVLVLVVLAKAHPTSVSKNQSQLLYKHAKQRGVGCLAEGCLKAARRRVHSLVHASRGGGRRCGCFGHSSCAPLSVATVFQGVHSSCAA